jgi:hypothetical protein
MRNFLPVLCVLTFSLSSCGQDYKEYNFRDIGMHIKMPSNHIIQDDFPKPSFLDANGKQIIDTVRVQELQADLMKGLVVVSSPDGKNTASFNLVVQTAKTGDFEQYYNFSKDIQQLMAKQQMTNYDSASSVSTADNVKVHKFMTYSNNTIPVHYSGIYLAQVGKYFLVIKTDYTDKKFGEEIEKVILTAKFD